MALVLRIPSALAAGALAATAVAQNPILRPAGPVDVGQLSGLYLEAPTGTGSIYYSLARLNPPVALGLGDLWIGAPRFLLGSASTTSGVPAGFFFTLPDDASLIGVEVWLQALANPSDPGPLQLSNGLWVRIGPVAGTGPLQGVPFELFGRSIAAGDDDLDGADEIVVGVPGGTTSSPSLNQAGWVAVYSGAPLSFETSFTASPSQGGGRFGYSVAMGQVDGLSGDDLIVAEPLWDESAIVTDVGRVHVFLAPGFAPLTALTAAPGFFGQDFGWKVGAIDFDGDGDASVVASAPAHIVAPLGRVYVHDYVGPGFALAYSLTEPAGGSAFGLDFEAGDLTSAPGLELAVADPERSGGGSLRGAVHVYSGTTLLTTLASPAPVDNGRFGDALAAGDLTGDGQDELVIGEPGQGKAYVYSYTGSAWSLVDEVLVPGMAGSATFGADLLVADLDPDGADELVVGQIGSSGLGRAWVFFGTPGAALSQELFGLVADVDTTGNLFGSVLAAGDSDGDGALELYCGAPTDVSGFVDSGKVFRVPF